jgi:hypothetical protein
MNIGETKTITIAFQNTGTSTWKNTGTNYISLYTHGPKYRTSAFQEDNWISATQVSRMPETSVAPSESGTMTFSLEAPSAPGTYKETFALAAESLAWVQGGEVTLSITVTDPQATSTAAASYALYPTPYTLATSTSAARTFQSATSARAKSGSIIPLAVTFQNTGTSTWHDTSLIAATGAASGGTLSNFANSSWQKNTIAAKSQTVNPGQTVTLDGYLSAPAQNGTHMANVALAVDGVLVNGAVATLSIIVDGGNNEPFISPDTFTPPEQQLQNEPNIRVGVLIVDEETNNEVRIASFESPVELRDTSGLLLAAIPATTSSIRAYYENGLYYYGEKGKEQSSALPLRFTPTTPNAVLTIVNFDRRVTRGTEFANNTFRNTLELRYNDSKERTWVINELPIEYYLRGLAEAGESSPVEMQKAVITAARSYAHYYLVNGSKHEEEYYDIDSARDQVYWGQGQESRTPRLTAAVEDTRGNVVLYNNMPAMTTYFSRSSGRTLSWKEAWGRDVPYALSVVVPCDAGKTLLGHGIGMSLSGAICMANDGQTFDSILKYFYNGIELKRVW